MITIKVIEKDGRVTFCHDVRDIRFEYIGLEGRPVIGLYTGGGRYEFNQQMIKSMEFN